MDTLDSGVLTFINNPARAGTEEISSSHGF